MLDVDQIARWAGCVGGTRTTIAPIVDAKHDVFLSLPEPRAEAYRELDRWLDRHLGAGNRRIDHINHRLPDGTGIER